MLGAKHTRCVKEYVAANQCPPTLLTATLLTSTTSDIAAVLLWSYRAYVGMLFLCVLLLLMLLPTLPV